MTTVATIAAQLILDMDKFAANMKKADNSAAAFDKRMKEIGKNMQKIGAGMTLALTLPIVAFGSAAVKSAMESEAAIADLEATLKSTGGIAGVTSQEIQDYAKQMQMLTKFSDEEIISANAMLLTFTKIGRDILPQASDAVLDMAQKFGMDASQAAITLGKALNDPIGGVTALRRIGVMLTDEQEEQIKGFMAVNDVASAQAIILKELSVEIGGVAEAYGQTAAGQMAIFNNQLDELKESIGRVIIPVLIDFMKALTPLIQKLAEAPPWVQKLIVVFLGLVAIAGPLIFFIGSILSMISSLSALGLGTAAVGTALAGIAGAIVALLPLIALIVAALVLWWLIANHGKEVMITLAKLILIVVHAFKTFGASVTEYIDRVRYSLTLLFEDGSGILLDLAVMFGIPKKAAQEFLVKVYDAVSKIINIIKTLWSIVRFAFSGIVNMIAVVIFAIQKLVAAFARIKLPKMLTPGSPTPFEMGLRGISNAMDEISGKSLPKLGAGMAGGLASNSRTSTQVIDNRVFGNGLDAQTLRIAIDNKFKGIEKRTRG